MKKSSDFGVYEALSAEIEQKLKSKVKLDNEYVPFDAADYVDNPIALARIKAHLTQEQLAKRMKVSQAYISKIERQHHVTAKLMQKVKKVLIDV